MKPPNPTGSNWFPSGSGTTYVTGSLALPPLRGREPVESPGGHSRTQPVPGTTNTPTPQTYRPVTSVGSPQGCQVNVRRGLAWLERVCPADSIDAVDLDALDAECCCVLDQIFGDFLHVVDIAKAAGLFTSDEEPLPGRWLTDHGFDFPDGAAGEMTEAWRSVLAERLAVREGVTS